MDRRLSAILLATALMIPAATVVAQDGREGRRGFQASLGGSGMDGDGNAVTLDLQADGSGVWESDNGTFEAYEADRGAVHVVVRNASDGDVRFEGNLTLEEFEVEERADGQIAWSLDGVGPAASFESDGTARKTGNASFDLSGSAQLATDADNGTEAEFPLVNGTVTFGELQEGDRGDDEDDEREDDEREEREEERRGDDARRRVEARSSEEGIVYELEKETDASEEKVKIEFSTDEAELKLEFERETNASEETFEYKVEFARLVEYQDADGDDVLSDGDVTVSQRDLDAADWTVGDVRNVTVDGKAAKRASVTADLGDNGTFTVVLTAVGDFAKVNATTLRPTDVKVDFVVDRYPWSAPISRLALDLKTEVKSEHEVEAQANGTAVNASTGNVSGYFAWAPNATVDGTSRDVTANAEENETDREEGNGSSEVERETKLTLNYPQGERIVHDPVLGVTYATAADEVRNRFREALPAPAVWAVLAGIGVALALGRWRRT